MATKEQIRKMVQTVPFAPFRVTVAGGPSFLIEHPENAACDQKGRELVLFDKQGAHYADLRLVTVVESAGAPGEGQGPGVDPATEGNGPA
jgi:hypothetical protein